MLLEDGRLISDGRDIVAYLDERMADAAAANMTVTGIIVSTNMRKELSKACRSIMGIKGKDEETVNKFRGALLIEDGEHPDRLEVIQGSHVTEPVESIPFGGLKPVRPGRRM